MNQRQSWKWDAEAAFKRIESDSKIYAQEPGQGERASRFLYGKRPHKAGWTPAPDPRAYMKAKPDVYKGRDYEAILRAAKKPPVGYWEDAPHGIKFGGQPLPSAGTKPHGKDVDTAEMHKGERLSIPTKLIGGTPRDGVAYGHSVNNRPTVWRLDCSNELNEQCATPSWPSAERRWDLKPTLIR